MARLLRSLLIPAILLLAATDLVPACTVCYGDAEGQMVEAASMGVWLLIAVIGAVQSSFAVFFIYLWRRARRFATRSAR